MLFKWIGVTLNYNHSLAKSFSDGDISVPLDTFGDASVSSLVI